MDDSRRILRWMKQEYDDKQNGFIICEKCNGRGFVRIVDPIFPLDHCKKCNGTGKITWLQNIFE